MTDIQAARTALVQLLAAYHADGQRLINLILTADDNDDDDPRPTNAKARRPREVPGQGSLF